MIHEILVLTWTIAVFVLNTSKCSLVMERHNERGIYIKDFCPKSPYCEDGTHVMCMYYDPERPMGPHCANPQNVSLTLGFAERIVDITNRLRSRMALGIETGKNNAPLPRGYGMMKLKWDSELATFAQVLANQCMPKNDLCRSSKNFPFVEQLLTLHRFTYPEWQLIRRKNLFSKKGLTNDKIWYTLSGSIKIWHLQKYLTEPKHLAKIPLKSYREPPNPQNVYPIFINGAHTHMGCGFSAFTEYDAENGNKPLILNTILVVCNFSSRLLTNKPVVNMVPPSEPGYTVNCGCPIGYDEDEDCLCSESNTPAIDTPSAKECELDKSNCKPALVILPIFTVENAPREKLMQIQTRKGFGNITMPYESSMEIQNIYQNNIFNRGYTTAPTSFEYKQLHPENVKSDVLRDLQMAIGGTRFLNNKQILMENNQLHDLDIVVQNQGYRILPPIQANVGHPKTKRIPQKRIGSNPLSTPRINVRIMSHNIPYDNNLDQRSQPVTKARYQNVPQLHNEYHQSQFNRQSPQRLYNVKKRYFDKNSVNIIRRDQNHQGLHQSKSKSSMRPSFLAKPSIFSRVAKFQLPLSRKFNSYQPTTHTKKDVSPRKDFSIAQRLIAKYLTKKRSQVTGTNSIFNRKFGDILTNTTTSISQHKFTPELEVITMTTEHLNTTTEKSNNFIHSSSEKFHFYDCNTTSKDLQKGFDINSSNEEADKKLMTLLDNLEQEVKHIQLKGNEKEFFDAKIRKIYNNVLRKPPNVLTQTHSFLERDTAGDYVKGDYVTSKYETNYRRSLPVDNFENELQMYDPDHHFKQIKKEVLEKVVSNTDYTNDNKNNPYAEELKNRKIFKSNDDNDDIKFKNIYRGNDVGRNRSYRNRELDERRNYFRKEQNVPEYSNFLKMSDNEDVRNRNYDLLSEPEEEDPLGYERRKFYQDKLENIEKKLHHMNGIKRRNEHDVERQLRLVRPHRNDLRTSRFKNQMSTFYMPERARFLHGF